MTGHKQRWKPELGSPKPVPTLGKQFYDTGGALREFVAMEEREREMERGGRGKGKEGIEGERSLFPP